MIISIDPGLTGAAALLDNDGDLIEVFDMPVSAKTSGKGNQVNAVLLSDFFREKIVAYGSEAIEFVIERVGPMPGQGVTGMFGFGRSLGVIEGSIAAYSKPVTWVTPQKWKKRFSLVGKDKDASRTLVLEKFPNQSELFKRKKDAGRADAVLIGLSTFH